MQGFELRFPAVRGIQAGREFYMAMCPLRVVPRLFAPDQSNAPPGDRGQRILNKGRIPRLARFLAENPEDYAVSAITATINGDVEFEQCADQGDWQLGRLVIPMSSELLITDGQHRWRAICGAVKQEPRLEEESVPVVFYVDESLERRQQMFADLNMHAVRPTRSLGILYDHRDPVAGLAREVSDTVPIFRGRTEVEKTTISNRSGKLFTLSAIYQATAALLSKREGDGVRKQDHQLAARYWTVLGEVLPGWKEVIAGSMKPWELRARYIHAHGVVLQALGAAGCALVEEVLDWEAHLRGSDLTQLDWSRANSRIWEGRALSDGRVSKAQKHVALTGALFKTRLSLSLSRKEKDLEIELERSRRELWSPAT